MFSSDVRDLLGQATDAVSSGSGLSATSAAQVLRSVAGICAELAATQHPLGFLHVDLSPLVPCGSARLHLWNEEFVGQADPLGRLHDHTWELRSAVLAGSLVDHVLEPSSDPRGPLVAYAVRYGNHANQLERLAGHWRLEEVEARSVGVGSIYSLAAGLVHRTEVSELPTVTLVVPIERGGPGPRVFASSALKDVGAAPRRPVSAQAVRAALLDVVENAL